MQTIVDNRRSLTYYRSFLLLYFLNILTRDSALSFILEEAFQNVGNLLLFARILSIIPLLLLVLVLRFSDVMSL